MAKSRPDVGEAELEVLKVLWDHGPCTVRQVLEHLHGRGRRVAYTTALTFLTRLEQKEFVASDKAGVAHVFRAKVSRRRVVRSRLRSVIAELFDGAPGPLVLELMSSETFTPDELASFRRLIEEIDAAKPGPAEDEGGSHVG